MAKVKNATGGEYESYQAQSEAAAQPEQPTEAVEEEDLSDHEEEEKDDEEDPQIPEEENSHDGNEETGNEHAHQPEQPTVVQAPSSAPYLRDEDESLPLPPEKFYFSPKQYRNSCKIASRCYVKDTVTEIKKYPNEFEFFTRHPQLKHIFHIAEEPNRKSQGLWMLLLHHAWTEKENELWFVVNGVPIRYSIKEHALLSGLDCHDYPSNYNDLKDKEKGDYKFVERWFQGSRRITIADVEKKLVTMKSTVNKKKMALLYVLSNVLKAKSKVEGYIEPFLLKVVDDLKLCETFPWGRYTFDDCIAEVKKIMKKFKRGIVKEGDTWCFSGFILPLEAFAFECIPELGRTFRVSVDAEKECPRLCKHMFKDTHMKGYPLEDINEAIGRSKDIISILEPTTDEESLMERIIDPGCDDGIGFVDPIVEGWRNHLIVHKKNLWWESLYEEDLAGRCITENVGEDEEPEMSASIVELKDVIKAFTERMDRMEVVTNEIQDKFRDWIERLVDVETSVKDLREKALERGPSSCFGEPSVIRSRGTAVRADEMVDVLGTLGTEDQQREEGRESALEEEGNEEDEEKEEAVEPGLEEEGNEEDEEKEEAVEPGLEEEGNEEAGDPGSEEEEKEEDEEPHKKKSKRTIVVERKERLPRLVKPSAANRSPYVHGLAKAKATGKEDGKKRKRSDMVAPKGKKKAKGKKKE